MIDIFSEDNQELLECLTEPKLFQDNSIKFPTIGEKKTYRLTGVRSNQEYLLDAYRGTYRLTKVTYQNRVYKTLILLRLDIDTKPHVNPDGNKIGGTHIHVFHQTDSTGSWAFELDDPKLSEFFPLFNFNDLIQLDPSDMIGAFQKFCELNHIDRIASIDANLFS